MKRINVSTVLIAAFTIAFVMTTAACSARTETQSARSAPPDLTPYTRPAVPEDCAPSGGPAAPGCPEALKAPR